MRRSWLAIPAIGVAGGVAAEVYAFDVDQPVLWIPDLVVGVVLIIAGASVLMRVRGTGVLFTAAGMAWFAGTAVPPAVYWHRGVLVHLLVAYPVGRLVSRTGWLIVAAGYAVAAVTPVWRDDATAVVLGAVAVGLSLAGLRRAWVRRQRSRRVACEVGAGLAVVVVSGAIVRLALPSGVAGLPSLLVYEAALVVAAVSLWMGLRPVGVDAVTDLVVELGGNRSASLRDALADLLGDPTARLGYWQASRAAYIDDLGELPNDPPASGAQTLTTIDQGGRPFAAFLHDSAVVADATLTEAVAAADQLMSAHTVLQADVRAQVTDVSMSRRRLQRAADEERRRLERRLATAGEAQLIAMAKDLKRIAAVGNVHLLRALDQLERTVADLDDAARGLYPGELTGGLFPAVAALSSRCPVPVTYSVTAARFDPDVEMAIYYLCAEALTNVVKHAHASAVHIEVAVRSGMLAVTVADDGVGGAAVTGGTGILGLTDRVESNGGRLQVDSGPGAGTTLAAEFPLDGQR